MSTKMISFVRRTALLGLAAAVGFGAWQLSYSEADRFRDTAEDDLRERFAEYVELRQEDAWPALYELVNPGERTQVSLKDFLNIYAQGILTTHDITIGKLDINYDLRVARIQATTEAELVIDNLPPQFRNGFRMPDDPEELRRVMEHEIIWVWRAGQWFYSLDEEVLTGHAQGDPDNPIQMINQE